MISQSGFISMICAIAFTIVFAIIILYRKKFHAIQRLYLGAVIAMLLWFSMVALLRFVTQHNGMAAYVLDSFMYTSSVVSPLMLMVALGVTKGFDKTPKRYFLLLLVPALVCVLVWTNPLHHLFYQQFSVLRQYIVVGPLMLINAGYSYLCLVASSVVMIAYAYKERSKLHYYQAILFSVGAAVPLIVNFVATFGSFDLPITATPLSFSATIICHGLAITQFHMLDLKPVAMQRVLDRISDCYLVVSDENLVVSFNKPFFDIIGVHYGVKENLFLQDCAVDAVGENRAVLKNLLVMIDTCRKNPLQTNVSYEQTIFVQEAGEYKQRSYMVEITALQIEQRTAGFAAIFKDVTRVKESMERLAQSQKRMMENERLASLGHMIGGIAHNLKTPIMSISGGASAIDELVEESARSIGDAEVTEEDFREIYAEMSEWTSRIKNACTYMSEIITAVKGQAASISSNEKGSFTISDLFKHVLLLLRHELLQAGCRIVTDDAAGKGLRINGDINNMVQVVNNLVSNAIDAMRDNGGGEIILAVKREQDELKILVKDKGSGIAPEVKAKLFKQMITSKGAGGTGLGIFISNSVMNAKFGGTLWFRDRKEGGTTFGITIPMDCIVVADGRERERDEKE